MPRDFEARFEAIASLLDDGFKGFPAAQAQFRDELKRILRSAMQGKRVDRSLSKLARDILRSIEAREARTEEKISITYPDDLPVVQHREEIAEAIKNHQVVVISGDTGSGKTTQIPKICLELGRGATGMIGCTQPRRIAALTVTARVAEELNCAPGSLVGHHIRFDQKIGPRTRIKYMTDGILLAETTGDRDLVGYDTLMIDEAHERSLNIDFLLGYIKQLLPRRPDLKVIVSSATLDVERFAKYFDDAPVIEIPGKVYPVEVLYRVPEEEDAPVPALIADAVEEISKEDPKGAILVFLAGERDIRETTDMLVGRKFPNTDVLPLMARLPAAEQRKPFKITERRRIVLATNVAETSVTIPGIRYVIDSGLARINRYNHHTQVQRLHIEAISRASADQRKGRSGRTGPGICFRLYSEEDFLQRDEFTTPEIRRTSLAGVILNMITLKLGDIATFPFIEPPSPTMIKEGYRELVELGALDADRKLTDIGKQLARFPLEPRLARMLIAAESEHALAEGLVIVAALSVDDPRLRPMDKQDEADQLHAKYVDERSDFIAILNLWRDFEQQCRKLKSQNRIRRYCRDSFLSFRRMREWRDVHEQLKEICTELKLLINKRPAEPETIHRALLSGLLSRLGQVQEQKEYLGARNVRFRIFPGSGVFKRAPKWVMAGEMVDTTRLYARCVAQIDSKWIEPLAKHLCKYHYGQPYWDQKSGFVRAEERATLYGLTISEGRTKHYGPIDPVVSREVFIRDALTPCKLPPPVPRFITENKKVIDRIRDLEHKRRRTDLLVEDETIHAFYEERLPSKVYSAVGLKRWLQRNDPEASNSLLMRREDLLLKSPEVGIDKQFPDHITLDGNRLPLSYRFERGEEDDGITCTAPVAMLPALKAWGSEWLVPGALPEKIEHLLRSLPKSVRRQLVPIPETLKKCMGGLHPYQRPLREALSAVIRQVTGVHVPQAEWTDDIPAHLRMNYRIVSTKGDCLASGRDLHQLEKTLNQKGEKRAAAPKPRTKLERDGITSWDLGELPDKVDVGDAGWSIYNYPALVDCGESVSIKLFADPDEAERKHRLGVRRLYAIQLSHDLRSLRKGAEVSQRMEWDYTSFGGKGDNLGAEIADGAIDAVFVSDGKLPRGPEAFKSKLKDGANRLRTATRELTRQVEDILKEAQMLLMDAEKAPPQASEDIHTQLRHLLSPGFPGQTPSKRLQEFPRYLRAVRTRLDRIKGNPVKDQQKATKITPYQNKYLELVTHPKPPPYDPDELDLYRWMLEEWRVSNFAQELGTRMPVSEKRLEEQWKRVVGK